MNQIDAWPGYLAPPGSKYTVVYRLTEGVKEADFSSRSVIRQVLDSRPGVDVFNVSAAPDKRVKVELAILREGTISTVLGNSVSDGTDQFWSIESVFRTDSGAPSRIVAGAYRFADFVTDPFDRVAETFKRTGVETGETSFKFGAPIAVLALGVALIFKGLGR